MRRMKLKGDPILAVAGILEDMKETGVEYQRRIRKGWNRRLRKQYATHL